MDAIPRNAAVAGSAQLAVKRKPERHLATEAAVHLAGTYTGGMSPLIVGRQRRGKRRVNSWPDISFRCPRCYEAVTKACRRGEMGGRDGPDVRSFGGNRQAAGASPALGSAPSEDAQI